MSPQDLAIIVIASLVGIAYLLKLRSYDIYEKEPFLLLLMVAVVGGIISIITSLFLYKFVDVQLNFIDAIVKIGLIEEISKLLALMLIFFIIDKNFNEIVDGIIYITAISLGFAIIENIFYAFSSETPFIVLFQRSIYSTLGHISFSGYMGIAFYIHKRIHKNYLGIMLSVVIAALAHGLYDGVIFHEELNFLFKIVFIGLVFLQFWLLKTTLGFSKFRVNLDENTFKQSDNTLFLYCCKCDNSIKSKELTFWKIKAGHCSTCNNIVFNSENLIKLFQYFRPVLNAKKILKKLPQNKRIISLNDGGSILFNTKRSALSSYTVELGQWLKEKNCSDRKSILDMPFFGYFLKNLGLKYLIDQA
jgi:RsiW-degrading membrane proteinase PrsW (M82 family)